MYCCNYLSNTFTHLDSSRTLKSVLIAPFFSPGCLRSSVPGSVRPSRSTSVEGIPGLHRGVRASFVVHSSPGPSPCAGVRRRAFPSVQTWTFPHIRPHVSSDRVVPLAIATGETVRQVRGQGYRRHGSVKVDQARRATSCETFTHPHRAVPEQKNLCLASRPGAYAFSNRLRFSWVARRQQSNLRVITARLRCQGRKQLKLSGGRQNDCNLL